jgi:hypothetical protein
MGPHIAVIRALARFTLCFVGFGRNVGIPWPIQCFIFVLTLITILLRKLSPGQLAQFKFVEKEPASAYLPIQGGVL